MRHRLLVTLVALLGALSFDAVAEEGANEAARTALNGFIGAVAAADHAKLEKILAPEYQIMRADGAGYDRGGYLESELPAIGGAITLRIDDLVATTSDDVMVARYVLEIDETIEGRAVARRAPRLTVFRRDGDRWLVTAHANFATPQ